MTDRVFVQAVANSTDVARNQNAAGPLTISETTGRLRVEATLSGGGSLVVTGNATPSDTYANPADAVPSWSLLGAYNRAAGQWRRVDSADLTSAAAIALASMGFGLKAQAVGYGYDGASYRPQLMSATTDALALLNAIHGNANAILMHRNQNGNDWWASRGGYVNQIDAFALPGILNVCASGAFNSFPTSLTPGAMSALQIDGRGNLFTMGGRPVPSNRATPSSYIGAGLSGVIKAAQGNPLSVDVSNQDATTSIFMLFDSNIAPALGNIPFWQVVLPAAIGARVVIDRAALSEAGLSCIAGIAWGLSSTVGTFTPAAPATGVVVSATFV